MKTILRILFFIVLLPFSAQAQQAMFCDTTSNVIIYSNYDGGVLNINVDQNIPNLKIGIVSYEAAQINISGTYAANVTQVWYAGYNGTNDNCNLGVTNSTISGVSNPVDTITIYPPATVSDPNGWSNIICGYSCTTGSQGGCNTALQIAGFFMNKFGATTIRFHQTNYNCWQQQNTRNISQGGNCCMVPLSNAVAEADGQAAVKTFPNPATGHVTIETPAASQIDVRLVDVLGREVKKITLRGDGLQTSWNLPLAGLASGVYMLDIHAGNKQYLSKLQIR